MKDKIRIIIADDHEITRSGIKLLLSYQYRYEVVGEAENGRQAVDLVKKLKPEIAILDIQMPNINGIEATRIIKNLKQETKVILLTGLNDIEWIEKGLKVPADGYIVKDIKENEIVEALDQVYSGSRVFSKSVLNYIETRKTALKPDTKPISFTNKEQEILKLIAEGKTNSEIAEIRFLSQSTINTYCNKLKKKAGVRTRAGLIKFAIQKPNQI